MKKQIIFPLLFVMIATSFLSCDKDDDAQPQTCPMTTASLTGSYKLTSQRYKPAGGVESEIIGTLNACERDNLLVLNSNTSFSYQDAGVPCSPPTNFSGDWSVVGSIFTLETQAGTITTWNCTNLVFYVNNKPNAGDRTTYTYTRQ